MEWCLQPRQGFCPLVAHTIVRKEEDKCVEGRCMLELCQCLRPRHTNGAAGALWMKVEGPLGKQVLLG